MHLPILFVMQDRKFKDILIPLHPCIKKTISILKIPGLAFLDFFTIIDPKLLRQKFEKNHSPGKQRIIGCTEGGTRVKS